MSWNFCATGTKTGLLKAINDYKPYPYDRPNQQWESVKSMLVWHVMNSSMIETVGKFGLAIKAFGHDDSHSTSATIEIAVVELAL